MNVLVLLSIYGIFMTYCTILLIKMRLMSNFKDLKQILLLKFAVSYKTIFNTSCWFKL